MNGIAIDSVLAAAVSAGKLSASSVANLKNWLTEPAYAEYHAALRKLIDAEDFATLDRLFWEQIPFGTGGRRGEMSEFGSATINRRTIGESANGLAVYVKQKLGATGRKAAVAHDSRNRSSEFAKLTASVFAANGFTVYFFEGPRSTPELSFAVRHLKCDTGVVISASHNPPGDNGFKAYWSTGGQVLAPHDRGVIECVYATREIPEMDFEQGVRNGQIVIANELVDGPYIQELTKLSLSSNRNQTAIFTPLHGVGETSVYASLKAAGFDGVSIFEPQRTLDGNFPNVPDQLPNPERADVFGPAIKEATQRGIRLVLASDPDADRLAVSACDSQGKWHCLTGNQTGALITDYILRKRKAAGTLSPQHYVVETLVTTPLIGTIAKSFGLRVVDDLLVGFKYIGETMDRLGPDHFVFGAEESLGYLAGAYARDKDAAVAGLYVMELAAELSAEGKTLLDQLHSLYATHGYHLEGQRSRTCKGPTGNQQIEQIMSAFRSTPPAALAGIPLLEVRDYQRHEVRELPSNRVTSPLPEPVGNLLMVDAGDENCRLRIALRPSGTEPKIKFYCFARSPVRTSVEAAAVLAQAKMKQLQDGLDVWIDGVLK